MDKANPEIYGAQSQIGKYWREGDFLDGYEVPLTAEYQTLNARQIAEKLMSNPPAFFRGLLWLRNKIVRPLGLKAPQDIQADMPRIGFFPIDQESEQEIVLGIDDNHLNFRIFVTKIGDKAVFGTWVRLHNAFGRAYLRVVSPFHNYISKYWQQKFIKSQEVTHA